VIAGSLFLIFARGGDGRLVQHAFEVCAREPRRAFGYAMKIDAFLHRLVLGVDREDGFAVADVGHVQDHAPVESPRTQKRGVEHVGTVGGRNKDDPFVRLESVHLDEQLVQRLLAFVVPAAEARAAMTADRVDLVDEDNARRVLLALLEQVAHARGADAYEHLDEIRTAYREERDARFSGDRLGEKGLAGAGRADKPNALGYLSAEAREFTRVF